MNTELELLRARALWAQAVNVQMREELTEMNDRNAVLRRKIADLMHRYQAVLDRLETEEQKERES